MISVHETIKPACTLPDLAPTAKILEELSALEKNIIPNWATAYPTLYSFLLTTITELCLPLKCPVPTQIGIWFKGVNAQQATAQIMTDGSTQLFVGAELIKRSLMDDIDETSSSAYRSFRWIIAHEIGHLCDPKFKLFAKSFMVRNIANKIAKVWLVIGMINLFVPSTKSILSLHPNFVIAASVFIVLQKLFVIALHRSFEYTADRLALKALPAFDIKDMQNALETMIEAIKPGLQSDQSSTLNIFVGAHFPSIKKTTLYKRILEASFLYAHPSMDKRLRRIRQLQ